MNRILRPLLLALPFLAAPLLAGCDTGDASGEDVNVTVMTHNLYLGSDLFRLIDPNCGTENPVPTPVCAALLYGDVVASDPAARMEAIAAEIDEAGPDLVGLQEVSWYRIDPESDYDPEDPEVNASTTTFDFLALLLDALEARGLNYTVAATNTNADVELPATTDGTSFMDIRLTDRDVILVREGTTYQNVAWANFQVAASVPIGGTTVQFTRGYSYGTATKEGVSFTFANSHLEVGGEAAAAQYLQANALVGALANAATPVVLVGDFNSDPADAGDDGDSYRFLTGTYSDTWPAVGSGDGFTCCQAGDLRNPTSQLSNRIDLVLYRGDVEPVSARVVGAEPDDRTPEPDRLWPSDHAGVVAELTVRN